MLSTTETSARARPSHYGSMGFLRQLAQDDALMAELKNNPLAVLGKQGLDLGDLGVPSKVTLPSTEALREAAMLCSEQMLPFKPIYAGFFGGSGD